MARAVDRFRSSDVALWGVIALLCWGGAVLSANLSALVPPGMFAGLHSSLHGGSTVTQLRAEVAALTEDAVRMRRENRLLLQQFSLIEQASGDVTRRVGALEISLPQLIEKLPKGASIDNSFTASIGDDSTPVATSGGAVAVTQTPLLPPVPTPRMPEAAALVATPPVADAGVFGVALGLPVGADEAGAQWEAYSGQVGTLLLGLAPLLQPLGGTTAKRLVAGPIQTVAQAEALCTRLDVVGIDCKPVPFIGAPLSAD